MMPEWEQVYLLYAAENLLILKLMSESGTDIAGLDYAETVNGDYVCQENHLAYLERLFGGLEPVGRETLELQGLNPEQYDGSFVSLPAYAAVAREWERLPADIVAEIEELAAGISSPGVPVVETLLSEIWGCEARDAKPWVDVWPASSCVVLRYVWDEGEAFTAQDMAWAIALKKALDCGLRAATAGGRE